MPLAANHAHRRLILILASAFGAIVLWSGWAPRHRQDWWLENLLVLLSLPVLWLIYRHVRFPRLSWILVFLFLSVHELGAHFTYSEVPYDAWWQSLTGRSFNSLVGWHRNNFDRIIHVLYGLLLAPPLRHIAEQWVKTRGIWTYVLPVEVTLSTSALYELIEWAAAEVFGGDLGVAYVGTQGDPWDAQKDIALATAAAFAVMLGSLLADWKSTPGFARDLVDSLRPSHQKSPDRR